MIAVMSRAGSKPPAARVRDNWSRMFLSKVSNVGAYNCTRPDSVLFSCGKPRLASRLHHVNHDRVFGFRGALILPDTHRQVEIDACVIETGGIDGVVASF